MIKGGAPEPAQPPASIVLARRWAWAQSAAGAVVLVLAAGYGLLAYDSDRRATRTGQRSEFAGLGVGLAAYAGAFALAFTVLTSVPALLLGRRRTAKPGWVLLVIVELSYGVLGLRFVSAVVGAGAPALVWLAFAASVAVVLASLIRPAARAWAAGPPTEPPI